MNAAKCHPPSRLLNLKRLLQGLLAVSAGACGAGALAQGSTVDCSVTAGVCVAECSASGAIGSIFGGGSSADRNVKSAQCRANCERDRLTCQVQASQSNARAVPAAPQPGEPSAQIPGRAVSPAPATTPNAGSVADLPCLEYLRRDEGNVYYANYCAQAAVYVLVDLRGKCTSIGVSAQNRASFPERPGHYKVVGACAAVDTQSTARCECAAGSDLPKELAYLQTSIAASYQNPAQTGARPSDRQTSGTPPSPTAGTATPPSPRIAAQTTATPQAGPAAAVPATAPSSRPSSQGECVKFRPFQPATRAEAASYPKPEGLFLIRNDCQVSVGFIGGLRCKRASPASLAPGSETGPLGWALVCRYASVLPMNTVTNDMGDAMMADCKCPAGTTLIQAPAAPAK